jgi:hypothetical protein
MKHLYNFKKPLLAVASILGALSLNAQVLYDNGPYFNRTGTGAGGANESVLWTTSLGMSTIGFGHQSALYNRVADDFVTTDCRWQIDSIVFFGYQTGSTTTSTFTGVNFRIWDSIPDAVGSTVVYGDTTTNRMTRTVWSGAYRITETTTGNSARPIMRNVCSTPGLVLPAGTYWIDWASLGSLASGPWAPARVPTPAVAITGNGRQRIGSTWNNLVDGGTGTPAQGLPFIIYGTILEPTAGAGPDVTMCEGVSYTMSGSGSSPNGPVTFDWTNGLLLTDSTIATPGTMPTDTTTFVIVVTDNVGCVATDTMVLSVLPIRRDTIAPVVCSSYTSPLGNTYTSSASFSETLVSSLGCDSVLQIDLTVNTPTSSTLNPTACVSYLSPAGNTYTSSGTYTETITNMAGCDSTITINLTVNGTATSSISPTVCNTYTSPSGMVITSSGMYMDTIPSAQGCDSIITIQLTVLSSSSASITEVACGSYTAPSSNVFTVSGTYMDTIANMAGCDSVITIALTVNMPSTSTMSATACDMYTTPSGNVLTSSGTYMDTIPNMSGCDSVITITLTINTVNTGVTVSGFQLTSAAAGATYQWVDCANNFSPIAGATSQSFTPTVDGSYAVIVTQNSCTDTSACSNIIGIGMQEVTLSNVSVYPNPVNDQVTIDFGAEQHHIVISVADMNGRVVKTTSVNAARIVNVDLDMAAGAYILTVQTDAGVVTKQLIKE